MFGDDWFALKAEAFARFFGTPMFLIAQTVIVAVWILVNIVGWWIFDIYPFILLNLAFSLQAAYAAPLILLAQTRQADRDKVTSSPMRSIARNCIASARRAWNHRETDGDAGADAGAEHRADGNGEAADTVEKLTVELHNRLCST